MHNYSKKKEETQKTTVSQSNRMTCIESSITENGIFTFFFRKKKENELEMCEKRIG